MRSRFLLFGTIVFLSVFALAQQNSANNQAPPSDQQKVTDRDAEAGESSSRETRIDIKPPANDAKDHPTSAAAVAGLKPSDIILAIDGETIAAADDLVRALTGEKIGKRVALDVLRGTERLTISVTPQERGRPAKT